MQAIKVSKPGTLEIVEVETPKQIQANEVLMKVKAAGICGSDIHIYHGTSPVATYPRVIGHEFVGEVVEAGAGVTDIKPGDHIVANPVVGCGECYPCSIGRENVCTSLKVRGVHLDGGMAEYVVLPRERVHQISAELDWAEAAMVEPFSIASQVMARGQIVADDTVLVMGAGPIGLAILQVVKNIGAKCLITDLLDSRLELAQQIGADVTINTAQQDLQEAVFAATEGLGVNVVVEAVGLPQLLEAAVKVTTPAGRIVVLGFDERPSQISQLDITKNELDIRGSRLNANRFPEVVGWFNNREVQPELLISHKFHFTEIAQAIKIIENEPEKACKIVLLFD